MDQDPDTFGHTRQDCGACDADRAASSEHSQSQVPAETGQCPLPPTASTVPRINLVKLTINAVHNLVSSFVPSNKAIDRNI